MRLWTIPSEIALRETVYVRTEPRNFGSKYQLIMWCENKVALNLPVEEGQRHFDGDPLWA